MKLKAALAYLVVGGFFYNAFTSCCCKDTGSSMLNSTNRN